MDPGQEEGGAGREEVTVKTVWAIIGELIGFDKFGEVEVMHLF